MNTFTYVVVFSLVGGLFSLAGGIALLSKRSLTEALAQYATPFAAGGLLAAVFLDLLKEGIHSGGGDSLLIATLSGVLLFFIAERFLRWFHHHHDEDEGHKHVSKNLIIFGDFTHNILDGVAIAAAFLISVPTGIVTALAIAAHEIPQEIGDFGLLLKRGMRRRNVLLANALTALGTTLAAIVTYTIGSSENVPLDVLLGLSAGFLLYIAMSDIIPTIHRESKNDRVFSLQPILLLLGVMVVGAMIMFAHGFIEHDELQNSGASETQSLEHSHSGKEHSPHEDDHGH